MRRLIVAALAAITALVLSPVAQAATTKFPTTINQQAVWPGPNPNSAFFASNVRSPKRACVRDRTVIVVITYTNGSRQLLDQDRISVHGAWAGGGTFKSATGIDKLFAKVTRKRIVVHHHRALCKAAKTPLNG
jgi:hypothetical protein